MHRIVNFAGSREDERMSTPNALNPSCGANGKRKVILLEDSDPPVPSPKEKHNPSGICRCCQAPTRARKDGHGFLLDCQVCAGNTTKLYRTCLAYQRRKRACSTPEEIEAVKAKKTKLTIERIQLQKQDEALHDQLKDIATRLGGIDRDLEFQERQLKLMRKAQDALDAAAQDIGDII